MPQSVEPGNGPSKSTVSQANPNPSSRFREGSRYSTIETVLESRFLKILLSTLLEPVSIGSLGAKQVLSAKSCQRLKLMNSTWDQKPFPDLSRTWVRVSLLLDNEAIELEFISVLIYYTYMRKLEKEESMMCRNDKGRVCLLYTSPSPRDRQKSRMPSSA